MRAPSNETAAEQIVGGPPHKAGFVFLGLVFSESAFYTRQSRPSRIRVKSGTARTKQKRGAK